MKDIQLWGVQQNNLKNIDVKIPLGSLTVICGPSGSGKSSLAFETLYAEGQRRYIESLSNYTKQFLNKAPKPQVEGVDCIPPAVALEQKNRVRNSKSTVGTATETIDYLRLLFEKMGKAYCPSHHIRLEKDSPVSGTEKTLRFFEKKRGYILCLIPREDRLLKGKELYELLLKDGFLRIYQPSKKSRKKNATFQKKKSSTKASKSTKKSLERTHASGEEPPAFAQVPWGSVLDLSDPCLKKTVPREDFYLVIDRLGFSKKDQGRLVDSISQAYKFSLKYSKRLAAQASILTTDGELLELSEDFSCSICGYNFPNITSQLFSFNSPAGACPDCNGFGNNLTLDEDKIIPNPSLSLEEGAIGPFEMPSAKRDKRALLSFCKKNRINAKKPWNRLSEKQKDSVWHGTSSFYGVAGLFDYLETKKYKMHVRVFLSRYKSSTPCQSCKGTRLNDLARQIFIEDQTISDLCSKTVDELLTFFESLKLSPAEKEMTQEVFGQLYARLTFLSKVGVGYLNLDRATRTLSGGEYQRISLSNQLGMELSQTLYVMDEPTVGLHPRDNDNLIGLIKTLRDQGNTLVVVEHDHDMIRNSSHVIEMGPGSGHLGGSILFSGSNRDFFKFEQSNTLPYLRSDPSLSLSRTPRPVNIKTARHKLELLKCCGNNVKNVDLTIPLNRLVTVTGVSGSGKSTLVSHTLYPAVARALDLKYTKGFDYEELRGVESLKNVLHIDQSPISKTSRSNPMTTMKIYDFVRNIFASTQEARTCGYTAGTFSLNIDGGRCPVCKGLGFEVVDMMFMDDIHILCDTCDGKKFRKEILEIKFRKKSILDVMKMTVGEAMDFFVSYPNIRRPLSILKDVGLDYLQIGQGTNTLSGGENQRLKVAKELHNASQKPTLYILDEPTTGLHFREVFLLLRVLHRLVDAGNSVVLIEHNLEVIRNSDYVIDIGPEASQKGGKIVVAGSPADIMKSKKSHTAHYLREYVENFAKGSKIRLEQAASSPPKKKAAQKSTGPTQKSLTKKKTSTQKSTVSTKQIRQKKLRQKRI